MLPSSALPTDGVQKPVHQVHNSILSLRGGSAPRGRVEARKSNFTPAMPPGWLAKNVSGVALFEEARVEKILAVIFYFLEARRGVARMMFPPMLCFTSSDGCLRSPNMDRGAHILGFLIALVSMVGHAVGIW
jgi:hypothetical protein